MTTQEAIEALDKMQSQVIHGSNLFSDIADVLRNESKQLNHTLEGVSRAAELLQDCAYSVTPSVMTIRAALNILKSL